MALLGRLLASAAFAAAAPTTGYGSATWGIMSATGLNSYPIVGGSFTITNITMPYECDPSYLNKVGQTRPTTLYKTIGSPRSGVGMSLLLKPLTGSQPPIRITGTLVLQSSAYESSLTNATFPGLSLTIDSQLHHSSTNMTGANCLSNGEPSQMVCAGEDAYGISILATLEHRSSDPAFWDLLYIQYNAK